MRRLLPPLLLFCSLSSFADEPDNYVEPIPAVDTVKEEKVSKCIEEYIKKQSKSYSKIAQANLYDLINNFDNIIAKIYGKKGLPDDIPYAEKIELLAKIQCEAYYKMGVLK
jgi:hypothetical protein